jgi:hypothetical protein
MPVGVKVSPIEYNKEKYSNFDLEEEVKKVITSQVDYEKDLDCITLNIFVACKIYEMVYNLKLQQEIEAGKEVDVRTFTSNLSKEADFDFFINRNEEYRKFLNMDLTQPEVDDFKKFFNVDSVMFDFGQIKSFDELIEKDLYQTGLKNPLCFKPVLFLAELYTEYSRKYRTVRV